MNAPRYIFFDYGNTISIEQPHDRTAGVTAIWQYITQNPYQITVEQYVDILNEYDKDIGRYNINDPYSDRFEFHQSDLFRIASESHKIEFSVTFEEMEYIYWKAACGGEPSDGLIPFLAYINNKGIKSAIVSNLTYSSKTLERRTNDIIPDNKFEFFIASSDYVFRKPNPKLFNVALSTANIAAADAWYVGDVARLDVDGAVAAGLIGVWYHHSRLHFTDKPTSTEYLTIYSWSDLVKILDSLE